MHVFIRDDDNNTPWSHQANLKARNAGTDDLFGWSVSLNTDGNTLAVGAYNEDSNSILINAGEGNDGASNNNVGAAYVFTRSGATWMQQAYLKASYAGISQQFGWSVNISADGNTLAVGAYSESSDATGINGDQTNYSSPSSGAVYTFTRSGITWSPQAYIKANYTRTLDRFGVSVALSADGDTLAVGADAEDSNAKGVNKYQDNGVAGDSGAVYVY